MSYVVADAFTCMSFDSFASTCAENTQVRLKSRILWLLLLSNMIVKLTNVPTCSKCFIYRRPSLIWLETINTAFTLAKKNVCQHGKAWHGTDYFASVNADSAMLCRAG